MKKSFITLGPGIISLNCLAMGPVAKHHKRKMESYMRTNILNGEYEAKWKVHAILAGIIIY